MNMSTWICDSEDLEEKNHLGFTVHPRRIQIGAWIEVGRGTVDAGVEGGRSCSGDLPRRRGRGRPEEVAGQRRGGEHRAAGRRELGERPGTKQAGKVAAMARGGVALWARAALGEEGARRGRGIWPGSAPRGPDLGRRAARRSGERGGQVAAVDWRRRCVR